MILFLIVALLALASTVFDAVSTVQGIAKGYVEAGPIKYIIGTKPKPTALILVSIGVWFGFVVFCAVVHDYWNLGNLSAIPLISLTGVHLYGGIHNLLLYRRGT